jgi:hypothetical protein
LRRSSAATALRTSAVSRWAGSPLFRAVAVHQPPRIALGALKEARVVELAAGRPVQRPHQQRIRHAHLYGRDGDLPAVHSRRISAAYNIARHRQQFVPALLAELL